MNSVLSQSQFWLVIGAIGLYWLSYRLYLRVGRRCRKCGSIFGVKRVHKIRLAPDESISVFSTQGKLRWWIRRIETETFSVCKCKWRESVKVTMGPISVWHAWWAKVTNRQCYFDDPDLNAVSAQAAFGRRKAVGGSELAKNAHLDTPPLPLLWNEGPENSGDKK